MKLRPNDVSELLDAVITGRLQRDTAEEWAQRWLDLLDDGRLVFEPPDAERHLYEAITYLQTIGRRHDDGALVHPLGEVTSYRARLGF